MEDMKREHVDVHVYIRICMYYMLASALGSSIELGEVFVAIQTPYRGR